MWQFFTILGFELKGYLKNKIFVGITLLLVAICAVVMFFPRISALFADDGEVDATDRPVLLLAAEFPEGEMAAEAFSAAFEQYEVRAFSGTADELTAQLAAHEAECAVVLHSLTDYTYYVNDLSMYDTNTIVADEVLQSLYRMREMVAGGMTPQEAQAVMSAPVTHEIENLGKDQMQNFFYTYIMVFALYMVILLYGQLVATNVASEKSSRAMELLVTSAKPVNMMFGKVIASCLAGLLQLVALFGSAFLFFNLNRADWSDNDIVTSIFDIPVDLFLYMLLFFVLGFFIYAFLYGAIGSTVSKLEDVNTAVMPITFLFIVAMLVVMFSMGMGDVDNLLMIICSYIPFTSPMAMFSRLAMSTVPFYEVAISVGILAVTLVGVGVLAAKIYRVGVLLYGTKPRPSAIFKAIRRA